MGSVPVNTFTTNQAIGNREDLIDIIYRIDPIETPFMSGIDRDKCTAVWHEWQTQALAAPDTNNARLEGQDAQTVAATPTVRLNNRTQISDKVAQVSGTQQSVESAGRSNEMAYQEMLKGLEIKRDLEAILMSNQAKLVGSSTVPPRTGAILSWMVDNVSMASDGANPTAADGASARTDGTQIAFTEIRLKEVLSSIWTGGGRPNIIMTGAFNKQRFSTFTGRSVATEEAKRKKITASVDAYESDFGTLKVVPNRFQRPRDVHVLQMNMWAVAFLPGRNMTSIPLARTGDSVRRQVLVEYCLVARQPKASGGVYDCTVQ